jgi:hypothetical protein
MTAEHTKDGVRAAVRDAYGRIAQGTTGGCCAPGTFGPGNDASLALGYSADDLASVPEGANMGLGCGNPQAIAGLREGETVLDLGAGGGFDCFLAAKRVGPKGRVVLLRTGGHRVIESVGSAELTRNRAWRALEARCHIALDARTESPRRTIGQDRVLRQ